MNKTIKAALITGILGFMGTVAAAFWGTNAGKDAEKKEILAEEKKLKKERIKEEKVQAKKKRQELDSK